MTLDNITEDYFGIVRLAPGMITTQRDPLFKKPLFKHESNQVILAGMLTGVQGDIRCKVLAALSTVK